MLCGLTVYHLLNRVGILTTDNFSLADKDGSAPPPSTPTITMTAPANNSTVSGTVALSATVANAPVNGLQFLVDGSPVGSVDTSAPYSINFDTTTLTDTSHTVSAQGVGTNDNITYTATPVTVTVNNATPPPPSTPTITMTAPANNSTVSGTVALSATVANAPVNGLQFLVDGSPVGSLDTAAPYSINFDTTTLTNASHQISARGVGTNDNITYTATPVAVTVNNATPPPPPPPSSNNLILNPSLESGSGSTPDHWLIGGWGTNSASYTYPVAGQDGARAARVDITSYTSGDAKWYNEAVPVTPGSEYNLSDYYRSNTTSEIDIEYTLSTGKYQYAWITELPAASDWQQFSTTITVPANAVAMSVLHLIFSVGWLETDNFSLTDKNAVITPSIAITAPAANSTVSGTVALSATVSNAPVNGIQFLVDNNPVGSEDTAAPYTIDFDTTSLTNASHQISARGVGTNDNITYTATPVAVTVDNATPPPPTPPVLELTAPIDNATISGTATFSATVNDAPVNGIQFLVDNNPAGALDTTVPYSIDFDTTTLTNTTHQISIEGVGTNDNIKYSSLPITVTVDNTPPPPPPTPTITMTAPADNSTPPARSRFLPRWPMRRSTASSSWSTIIRSVRSIRL